MPFFVEYRLLRTLLYYGILKITHFECIMSIDVLLDIFLKMKARGLQEILNYLLFLLSDIPTFSKNKQINVICAY